METESLSEKRTVMTGHQMIEDAKMYVLGLGKAGDALGVLRLALLSVMLNVEMDLL